MFYLGFRTVLECPCLVCIPAVGTCARGVAWADKAYATDTAHSEVECSNAGVCDRATGMCGCFSPFTGAACQRGATKRDRQHDLNVYLYDRTCRTCTTSGLHV